MPVSAKNFHKGYANKVSEAEFVKQHAHYVHSRLTTEDELRSVHAELQDEKTVKAKPSK